MGYHANQFVILYTSVVHKHINTAKLFLNLHNILSYNRRICYVEIERMKERTIFTLVNPFVSRSITHIVHDDMSSFRRKNLCDCFTNPPGGASYNTNFVR